MWYESRELQGFVQVAATMIYFTKPLTILSVYSVPEFLGKHDVEKL